MHRFFLYAAVFISCASVFPMRYLPMFLVYVCVIDNSCIDAPADLRVDFRPKTATASSWSPPPGRRLSGVRGPDNCRAGSLDFFWSVQR